MNQQIINGMLKDAVISMDTDLAAEGAREALRAGLNPLDCINDGLAAGMQHISDLFDNEEAFVPELLMAAEAFEVAVEILTETLSQRDLDSFSNGVVIVHTVENDIHDIGKNIVKVMFSANNFRVYDLGRDVPAETVMVKAKEYHADIIVGSALMTTTMPGQKEVVCALNDEGIRDEYIVLFGGAPVTESWCVSIGADGYSNTASEAIAVAKKLLQKKKVQKPQTLIVKWA